MQSFLSFVDAVTPITISGEVPAGLADTFAIGLLLRGQGEGGTVYRANTIMLQGDQVFVGDAPPVWSDGLYLSLVVKGR